MQPLKISRLGGHLGGHSEGVTHLQRVVPRDFRQANLLRHAGRPAMPFINTIVSGVRVFFGFCDAALAFSPPTRLVSASACSRLHRHMRAPNHSLLVFSSGPVYSSAV